VIAIPKSLEETRKKLVPKESLEEVYKSLFKTRDSKPWVVASEIKSDFLGLRRLLKWYLRVVRLDLDNSSTFACDDLLNYLEEKGDIAGWKKGGEILRCKAGFMKTIGRGLHKQQFEEGKENLLKKQKIKLKKDLRELHKELIYNRTDM